MGSHVVLGEGDRDKAFLEYLCKNREITGLTVGFAGGNSGFGQYLLTMSTQPRFSKCESILLMSDNDELEDKCFELIRGQLKEIDFPVPSRPLEIARKQDRPAIAVLMQPYPSQGKEESGCLETLLIPAMESAHQKQASCIDEFLDCSGVKSWNRRDARDKAKIRCLISTVYSQDPMHGLHLCFSKEKNLIPLHSPVFDETALILAHFQEWSRSGIKSWIEWRASNGI
jgi:hypothetical protein